MKILFLIPLFLLFGICPHGLKAQSFSGNKRDINKIRTATRAFSQAYMNADYEAMADAYTPDGKIFPGGVDIIEGRDAIQVRWTLPPTVSILKHVVNPVEIAVKGKTAYDFGYYEGQTLNAKGETINWKGKYVIVWKKARGEWKMYLDIWNRTGD
jgi:ketosteroid isomerase-like protein